MWLIGSSVDAVATTLATLMLNCCTCGTLLLKMCCAVADGGNGVALAVLLLCCRVAVTVAGVLLLCFCGAVALAGVMLLCCCGAVAVTDWTLSNLSY